MNFTVLIPARFASERLPGKALVDIAGLTMIERVYGCAKKSAAQRVCVATDDRRIFDAVTAFGGEVVMTSPDHQSGTDRLQEAATLLSLNGDDIVVNVQGDEPLIPAAVIDQVAANLAANKAASAATLSEAVADRDVALDPNAVKVVRDNNGFALYFSRASIPWVRGRARANDGGKEWQMPEDEVMQRHIGIYAYRVSLLNDFVRWPLATLEKIEKLEQLRILANGHKIHVETACELVPGGIDTPEDLARMQALF